MKPDPPRRRRKMPVVAGESLGPLATEIRSLYIRERSAFEAIRNGASFEYRLPIRYDGIPAKTVDGELEIEKAVPSVWPKLAKFLVAREADPGLYVPAQFELLRPGQRPPEPPQMMTAESVVAWERAKAHKSEQIRLAFKSEVETFEKRAIVAQVIEKLSATDAYVSALADSKLALSPLFRYCLARSLEGPRFRVIARRHEVAACFQFQHYRAYYKRHWRALLPRGFLKHSRSVYNLAFGVTNADEEG